VIPLLRPGDPPDAFPPVDTALAEPDGLLCVGGDLSPARLLAAYRRGIFPWFSEGQPILWWSPDPRTVLFPGEFKVSRSLAKTLRNGGFEVTFDRAFGEVMSRCGDERLRPEGTWISPAMLEAYTRLHQLGFAHSVEAWRDGTLVGGLYGIALGKAFFGESMFSAARDASKVALHALVNSLLAGNVQVIDCQVATGHLLSLGARLIPRRDFTDLLGRCIGEVVPEGSWSGRQTRKYGK
jgi:leucyl/phenylalanyl-tRNA--protein transferase